VSEGISLLLPTSERAAALRVTFPALLRMRAIDEIVVVDDGSTDDTVAYVRGCDDARVRIVEHRSRRGVAAARNTAMDNATGAWFLWGEDDVLFGESYAEVLLAVAQREHADIVGAPWVNVDDPADAEQAWARARADARPQIGLDTVGSVPVATTATPFIPALALVSRRVFEAGVRYDTAYGGNAYREETAFWVEAARRGFRVVLTPETYSVQAGRWDGGHRRSTLSYEYWAVRNTARFLRRHGRWLHDHGYSDEPTRELLRFTAGRVRRVLSGKLRRLRGGQ
jgi:glycosyltransferase involved in cell wall biosynthesis